MQEPGVEVEHSTINRWVRKYAPELKKWIRPDLCGTNDSWQVDETYIEVKSREAIKMIPKGQVQGVGKGDVQASIELVSQLFEIAQ